MPRVTGIYGLHTTRGSVNENEKLCVVHVLKVVDFRRLKKKKNKSLWRVMQLLNYWHRKKYVQFTGFNHMKH